MEQLNHKVLHFAEAENVFPTPDELYSQKSDDGISVPIGYREGGIPFKLPFDDTHLHTMILGNTGSGKTNLLHVLMTNLILRYESSEVQVYLIDFKHGRDFLIYTQYNLPNFQSISIADDPESALAILADIEEELKNRSNLLDTQYRSVSHYNEKMSPDRKMSRMILIVDELYELVYRASEDVQKRVIMTIDNIMHTLRPLGIHVIVSGQDLNKIDMFDTICSQCATRLALHCSDEQVKALFSEDAVALMHTISFIEPGKFICTMDRGAQVEMGQAVFISNFDHGTLLQKIENHYLPDNMKRNWDTVETDFSPFDIFEIETT